jgi:hypothetical protein
MIDCGSEVLIDHCEITWNTNGDFAGAGVACSNTSPVFSWCTIENNTSPENAGWGGGVWLDLDSYALIEDCVINTNKARRGAGLASSGCDSPGSCLEVIRTHINNNVGYGTRGTGAAIEDSNVRFTDCEIKDNKKAREGGGVYLNAASSDCSAIFLRTVISGNDANGLAGGGIWAYGGGLDITIEDCNIDNNAAYMNGGGLYVELARLNMKSSTISGNTAGGHGGGIYYESYSSYEIGPNDSKFEDCVFSENKSLGWGNLPGGAGIYLENCVSPTILNCRITGNTLEGQEGYGTGAGMYLYDYSSPVLVNCLIAGNTIPGYGTVGGCILRIGRHRCWSTAPLRTTRVKVSWSRQRPTACLR